MLEGETSSPSSSLGSREDKPDTEAASSGDLSSTSYNTSEDHIESDNISMITSQTSDSIIPPTPQFSKDEIDSAYTALISSARSPPDAMVPALMQEASRRKIAALEANKYDLAREHDRIMSVLMQQLDRSSCEHAEESRRQTLQDREDVLKRELDKVKEKWEEKMQKQSESSETRLRLLREKHEREMREFRQKYKDPTFLHKFNRPSRDLLVLRRTEKKLALCKKYEDARRTKLRADRLQAAEEQKMREVISGQIQMEYTKLVENQKKEMERLLSFDNEMKAKLEAQEAKEVEPIKASLHGIDVRRGETVNKKMLAMTYISQFREGDGRGQVLLTPRTRKRMKELRDRKAVEMSIKPITDSQFDRLEELNRKRSKLPRLNSSMR